VVGVLGALVALAGIEHGIGEIQQGSVRPEGVVIESWPNAAAMEILQGEPAMTIIPNLLVTGILAIIVAIVFGAWAIRFGGHRHVASGLIALSVVLLLLGGGFGPPLLGIVIGFGARRLPSTPRHGRTADWLASAWPWLLGAAVVGYLGLMPGTVLISYFTGVESAGLTSSLAAIAFSGAALALVGARAHDRVSSGQTIST
jgi:hypothetical protein